MTDFETKYRKLRKRHTALKSIVRYFIKGNYYFSFLKDIKNYPRGEEYNKRIIQDMKHNVTGRRLLDMIGDLDD